MSDIPATARTSPASPGELIETSLGMLRSGQDTFAAVEYLAAHAADASQLVDTCAAVFRQLYWKDKHLARAIAIGRAGAQYALAAAMRAWRASRAATVPSNMFTLPTKLATKRESGAS